MNILVVDDQKIFLQSFLQFLNIILPGSIIHDALGGKQALDLIPVVNPDIILLDINMPEMNGLQVTEQVVKKYPQIKIVILTNVGGEAMTLNLLKRKVHGFLFKNIEGEEIKNCIDTVIGGGKYFCDEANQILSRNINKLNDLPKVELNRRETDIILLMKAGRTSKEIAGYFGIDRKDRE